MRLPLDATAAPKKLQLIEEDFRAPLAQRALTKAARIMHKKALANARAAKDTGLLASKVITRGKKVYDVKKDREVFAAVGTLGDDKKVTQYNTRRGRGSKRDWAYTHTSTPNKYAHLVEGGVGKYGIAPRPLYKAAYTASLHEMEQEIMKTVHKGLEVAIKKGKATRPAPTATGQGLLSL